MLREGDCIHGLGRYQCDLCYHPAGNCDFGICRRKARVLVIGIVGNERRPMCAKHAKLATELLGSHIVGAFTGEEVTA